MHTAQQFDLPLYPARERTPEDEALELRLFLRGRGWMLARDIAFEFPQWTERRLRELAEISDGQIVSGQRGYKLTVECTPEEAKHAQNWLRSQARKMIRRSIRIGRVFHAAATNTPVA